MSLFESQFDDIASVFGKQFVSDNFIDINKLNPLLYAPNHPIGNQATEVDIYNDLLELPEDSMNLEDMIGQAAEYLPDYSSQQQQQQGMKRESSADQHDGDVDDYSQASACLPRTLMSAGGEYTSMASPYEQGSPAGRSTTSSSSRAGPKSLKNVDKDSDEYRRRRQLNNIAVKKSREKAKNETRQTVQRLNALTVDKERLERRVEQLTKELQFLHGVFTKFADIPEPVRTEMARAFARLQIHNSR